MCCCSIYCMIILFWNAVHLRTDRNPSAHYDDHLTKSLLHSFWRLEPTIDSGSGAFISPASSNPFLFAHFLRNWFHFTPLEPTSLSRKQQPQEKRQRPLPFRISRKFEHERQPRFTKCCYREAHVSNQLVWRYLSVAVTAWFSLFSF